MAQEKHEAEVLEEGDIFFLYRAKVHEPDETGPEAEGIEDVERFYVVLRPRSGNLHRLIAVGAKHLPDVAEHERNWGFVEAVERKPEDLEKELQEQQYQTKTRGERIRPAARPAGEGVYAILSEDHGMRLMYGLELPERPGAVQKQLNIAPEASFVLSVKNPEKGSPPAAGLREKQQADFGAMQKEFRGRRFATEDPRLLDFEGAEIVMVGARRDPGRKYGIEVETERERVETSDIVRKLRMAKSRHPTEPLVRGTWT